MVPVIFEDGLHDNFYPLSLTRPLWELRCGLFTFRERFERVLSSRGLAPVRFMTRDYLAAPFRERFPALSVNGVAGQAEGEEFLLLNALLYADPSIIDLEVDTAVADGPRLLAARLSRGCAVPLNEPDAVLRLPGIRVLDPESAWGKDWPGAPRYIWELMERNGRWICKDAEKAEGPPPGGVTIIGDSSQVFCEEGVLFDPHVVLDAVSGPIVIGSGTRVHSFSRIEGPAAIGRECMVLGAKIRAGTSLGPFCRVGGEVEASIFQGYVNKYHDGFIGHACVGEWVNMGALTTNSDLKNDYSPVKVYLPDSRRKTGMMKMGCFIGDFVRTSIGTLINTGSVIGPGAMLIFGGKLTPPHVPPFCWFIDGSVSRVDWMDEFFLSCGEAMSRRGQVFTDSWRDMLGNLYIMTAPSCPLR